MYEPSIVDAVGSDTAKQIRLSLTPPIDERPTVPRVERHLRKVVGN
jgi:hypothetical protein